MQVLHHQDFTSHAAVGAGKVVAAKIAQTAEFYRVLSDTLYSDKPRAVVREILCNAWDAHIAAGVTNIPIQITLTDEFFIVRDFGSGIPDNKMGEIYLTYGGGSTKTHDGKQTGVIETVEITGQEGTGIQVTPTDGVQAITNPPAPSTPVKNAVVINTENDMVVKAPAIAPKDVNKKAAAAKPAARTKKETATVLVPRIKTRREQAAEYVAAMTDMAQAATHQRTAAAQLLAYKKAQKVSWDSLGVPGVAVTMMETLLAAQPEEPKIKTSKKVKDLSARMKAGQAKEPKAAVNDNPKAVRDAEVTRLIKLGKTTTEIHKETGVPRRTVDRIRDRVSNG